MTTYDIGLDVASYILRDIRYTPWVRSLSRPALYRVQSILASLINGEVVTAGKVAAQLEVSQRTIARDINYLINTLHIPIAYDAQQHTYVLKGPVPVLFAPQAGFPGQSVLPEPDTLVTLEVASELVPHFESVELHPSQRFKILPNGSGQLFLTVSPDDALAQWVMSYGGKVRVISPQSLRSRIRTLALRILASHGPEN